MKIPKIVIGYSEIYDNALSKQKKITYSKNKSERGEKFAKRLQKEWNKYAEEILTTMVKISKLKWKHDTIECFVSFETPYAFSHPLTININNNMYYGIDNLVHELTHILLVSNRVNALPPKSKILYKRYKKEKYNVKLHIIVHALIILTFQKVLGKDAEKYLKWERFWKIWPRNRFSKEYKKSWEIVQEVGAENIIRDLL